MFIQARNAIRESNSEMVNLNINCISSFRESKAAYCDTPVTEFCMVNGVVYKLKIDVRHVENTLSNLNLMAV